MKKGLVNFRPIAYDLDPSTLVNINGNIEGSIDSEYILTPSGYMNK